MTRRLWGIFGLAVLVLVSAGSAWNQYRIARDRPILRGARLMLDSMAQVGMKNRPVSAGAVVPGSQAALLLKWMQAEVAQIPGHPLIGADTRLTLPTSVSISKGNRAVVHTRFIWDRTFGSEDKVQQAGTATLWMRRSTTRWRVAAIAVNFPPHTALGDFWHFSPMPSPPFGIEKTATM